jgi:hypothetical protein
MNTATTKNIRTTRATTRVTPTIGVVPAVHNLFAYYADKIAELFEPRSSIKHLQRADM